MAGGEGSRLRPMTANLPKPLLPVANRPVMEHVLRLLRRHGITETVVTVQFLASLVRNYFSDGDELGMALQYATEERPLGTAGSVKNAEEPLRDDTFLVVSGDALTDVDLTALVEFHRSSGALVTVGLKSVPEPLEYGIVVCDPDGRVNRFLEKPTWGQVFSDTVNTGIYVMEPEVLAEVAADTEVDWSCDVFPELLARGAPVYGYRLDGYWEDVGNLDSYRQAHVAVLNREVEVDIGAFEVSPGVWLGSGADVEPDVEITGPVLVGDHARVEAGAQLRPYAVLGANVVVKAGAVVERAVVHDNVFIGPRASLRGCVVGRNTDIMRGARIDEGAIVGDECVVEQDAYLSAGVRVYPFKAVDAGAVVTSSVIWESRGHRTLFGPRGVSGLVNVEITPDLAVRLASAWASTMRKGSTVIASRDVSRAATAFKRAVVSALNASAIDVRDLEVAPSPVARFATAHSDAVGGIMIHTTPGDPQSVDLVFLDESGADLAPAAQRRLERVFSRQEFRRAFPGEIGQLSYPARIVETYTQEVLACVDASGMESTDLRVVIDTAGGAAAVVLPVVLGRLGVDALIVNGRLDDSAPTETLADAHAGVEPAGRARRLLPSRVRRPVRPHGRAAGPRRRPRPDHSRRACPAGRHGPHRRRAPLRAGGAAGDHDARRRGGRLLPRRRGGVDRHRLTRPVRSGGPTGRDLRRRRAGRLRRPRVLARRRRHRGVHPAAGAGGPHEDGDERDRRPDPGRARAPPGGAHTVGGQGRGHAGGARSGRGPHRRHHRRRPGGRGRRPVGTRAAGPGRGGDPPVGRSALRGRGAGSSRLLVNGRRGSPRLIAWAVSGRCDDNGAMTDSSGPSTAGYTIARPHESMSLFVDIAAQALDPSYAVAAGRRAAAPAPRRQGSLLAVGGVLAATLVIVIAAVQAHRRAPDAARARQTLVTDVRAATTEVAGLRHQVDSLRATTTSLRSQALASSADGAALARQLAAEEVVAGISPASGPGLRVVLSDSTGAAAGNRILDRDLQTVVNALWAAGAEAVAVDGERLTAQSAIRQAGSAILVNFQPLSPPYEVTAIGDPVELATDFGASHAADRMRSLEQLYGLHFDYSRVAELTLPGSPQPPLRYAHTTSDAGEVRR